MKLLKILIIFIQCSQLENRAVKVYLIFDAEEICSDISFMKSLFRAIEKMTFFNISILTFYFSTNFKNFKLFLKYLRNNDCFQISS